MVNLLGRIWRGFIGIMWPVSRFSRWSPALSWSLHALLFVLIAAALTWYNWTHPLTRWSDHPHWQKLVIPSFFVLGYAIAMLVWWLWTLLAFEQIASYYPDIDAAWEEAMYALKEQGIRIDELPLYLIVGRPESAERNLFEAAKLPLIVKLTPQDPRAPLHVCADRDAVYLTCAGVSLLGRLAGILALEEMGLTDAGEGVDAASASGPVDVTMRPKKKEKEIMEEMEDAEYTDATTLQRRRMRRQTGLPLGPNFLADSREVNATTDRLRHLCRLIVRERQPFIPINGILLLLPLGGTDTAEDTQQTSEACRRDLNTIRNSLNMDCPVLAMVCDMEVLPGFKEFMRRQDAGDLLRRTGQRFPLLTSLPRDEVLSQIRTAIRWMCNEYLQESVSKYFQIETAAGGLTDNMKANNAALFQLLDEMHSRGDRIAGVIAQTVDCDEDGLLLFGGCYFGATGGRGQQAFVQGIFGRLLKDEDNVTWTNRALANDASNRNQTSLGYLVITLAWLAMLGGGGFLIWKRFF